MLAEMPMLERLVEMNRLVVGMKESATLKFRAMAEQTEIARPETRQETGLATLAGVILGIPEHAPITKVDAPIQAHPAPGQMMVEEFRVRTALRKQEGRMTVAQRSRKTRLRVRKRKMAATGITIQRLPQTTARGPMIPSQAGVRTEEASHRWNCITLS